MKQFTLRLTEEQLNELDKRARNSGFTSKNEYIKFFLLLEPSLYDKVDAIYRKVVKYE